MSQEIIVEGPPFGGPSFWIFTAVKVFSFNNKLGILSTYGLNEADMDLFVAELAAHLGG